MFSFAAPLQNLRHLWWAEDRKERNILPPKEGSPVPLNTFHQSSSSAKPYWIWPVTSRMTTTGQLLAGRLRWFISIRLHFSCFTCPRPDTSPWTEHMNGELTSSGMCVCEREYVFWRLCRSERNNLSGSLTEGLVWTGSKSLLGNVIE